MSVKSKSRRPVLTVLLVIVAVSLWAYDQRPAPVAVPKTGGAETTGAYETYRNCTLAQARNNDGDSFMVRLPDGRDAEFRLYFVDTPESAFKSYAGGDTNHERIRQQAAEMGGISPQQAVEIGKQGKALTLGLLGGRPFDLHTRWDSPFKDRRYHAFVEVKQDGKSRWLHELLVERGLARIKTKPADLPDGTPAAQQRERLKDLERAAKRQRVGAWKGP